MFVDGGGWREPSEPARSGKPTLSKREETVLIWIILTFMLSLLIAPIGGGTIIEAAMTLVRR
jgi:hypothetical protein